MPLNADDVPRSPSWSHEVMSELEPIIMRSKLTVTAEAARGSCRL